MGPLAPGQSRLSCALPRRVLHTPGPSNEVETAASAPPARPGWFQRFGPYLVAALAVALVARKFSLAEIAANLSRGDWLGMAPWPLAGIVVSWLFATTGDFLALRAAGARPRWPALLRAKGAVTVLLIFHYVANQSTYGVWIARRFQLPPARAAGVVLYNVSSELAGVLTVAAISVWTMSAEEVARGHVGRLRWLAPAISLTLITLMLTSSLRPARERAVQGEGRWARFAAGALTATDTWRLVRPGSALLVISLRAVQIYWMCFAAWRGMQAFGIDVPLGAVATYMPIVLLVGALPANFLGVGAVTAVWLAFAPWARSTEQVLAFSLLFQLYSLIGLLARGVPFMRGFSADLAQSTAPRSNIAATLK